jgi:hypothetical protein
MVVEKNQNRSIFLATYWNLAQNSGHFIHGKSFVLVKIIQVEIWQNFKTRKHCT